MAKEIRMVTVKGKYATAIIEGSKADSKVKALTADLKEYKETLQDKTVKVEPNEQSVRLQAQGSDVTALLSVRRNVTMVATDDLKKNLRSGMYSGVVKFNRTVRVDPENVDKVLAILSAAGIKAEDVWDVQASAADLDKYRKERGADDVLGAAYTVDEVYAVKF